MEREGTTILSAVVALAGILAEGIFHETLTASVLGMVLSVVLALIILCCAYFALDGLQKELQATRKREETRRREYDEKVYRLLDRRLEEQVKLSKAMYLQLSKVQKNMPKGISESALSELLEEVNGTTMKAAKWMVKCSRKEQEAAGEKLDTVMEQVLESIRSMNSQLEIMGKSLENLGSVSMTAGSEDVNFQNLFDENTTVEDLLAATGETADSEPELTLESMSEPELELTLETVSEPEPGTLTEAMSEPEPELPLETEPEPQLPRETVLEAGSSE